MAENNIRVLIDTLYKRTGVRATISDLDRLKFRVNESGQVVDAFSGELADSNQAMKSLGTESRRFRFELLSVMFGAMAVNRAFSRLRDATVGSFTKIMESSGIFGTAIQQLSAEFEFLKFTIGSAINTALTPFLPTLRSFFQDVGAFVKDHPKGVFGTIFGGIAAGTIATVIAGGMLFLQALGNVQWATVAAGATKLGSALGKLGGATFVIKGIVDFRDFLQEGNPEDLWNGISNLLIGGGLFIPGIGPLVSLIGIGLKLLINTDEIFSQLKGFKKWLVSTIFSMGLSTALFGIPGTIVSGFKSLGKFSGDFLGKKLDTPELDTHIDALHESHEAQMAVTESLLGNSSAVINNTSNIQNLTTSQNVANTSASDLKIEFESFGDQVSNVTSKITTLAAAIQSATSAQLALNASVRGDD